MLLFCIQKPEKVTVYPLGLRLVASGCGLARMWVQGEKLSSSVNTGVELVHFEVLEN